MITYPLRTYELFEVTCRGHDESWRKSVSDRDEAIEWMRQYWEKMNIPMYARIMFKASKDSEAQWIGELTRRSKKSTEINPSLVLV